MWWPFKRKAAEELPPLRGEDEVTFTAHVSPIVNFMTWARSKGFVLGVWDGDGQITEVDDRALVSRYAVERFSKAHDENYLPEHLPC